MRERRCQPSLLEMNAEEAYHWMNQEIQIFDDKQIALHLQSANSSNRGKKKDNDRSIYTEDDRECRAPIIVGCVVGGAQGVGIELD